ncbi:siphovirus Gp157 family protein [Mesorhizobium sp. BR1-1-12]|uniref:siphovirus Gp157 family protein n=1 Tax=Mesorhizobium sp. BR1-1-12 TaxID=2876657 RepID=UPI001CD123A5|nr:siphovirus Gp157 family protein [Mesorhizobium sp. BR1-1-12]MBZ9973485.1 siphovirus Gp157 family protein [Mesorhizobium sp. BR1-1-12]
MKPTNDNRQQQYLQADVANLLAEIDSLFVAFPELAEDDTLRADMLEGSTAAFDVLTRLVNIERDADSMAKAVTSRISDLNARKARADKRKDAMRLLMLRIMKAAGIQKAPLVEATVSVGKGRDSVEIVDEAKLPRSYLRVVTSPDKTAIKAALDAGKKVRGAAIKTGDDVLTVRAA